VAACGGNLGLCLGLSGNLASKLFQKIFFLKWNSTFLNCSIYIEGASETVSQFIIPP